MFATVFLAAAQRAEAFCVRAIFPRRKAGAASGKRPRTGNYFSVHATLSVLTHKVKKRQAKALARRSPAPAASDWRNPVIISPRLGAFCRSSRAIFSNVPLIGFQRVAPESPNSRFSLFKRSRSSDSVISLCVRRYELTMSARTRPCTTHATQNSSMVRPLRSRNAPNPDLVAASFRGRFQALVPDSECLASQARGGRRMSSST